MKAAKNSPSVGARSPWWRTASLDEVHASREVVDRFVSANEVLMPEEYERFSRALALQQLLFEPQAFVEALKVTAEQVTAFRRTVSSEQLEEEERRQLDVLAAKAAAFRRFLDLFDKAAVRSDWTERTTALESAIGLAASEVTRVHLKPIRLIRLRPWRQPDKL